MGAVTIEQLTDIRPYFIVGSFVVAAIVTPPDVLSQLLLAFPMCVLYEVGIVAARVFGKAPRRGDEQKLPEAEGEGGP
jgi:sec-independent protein translocase protein TatC